MSLKIRLSRGGSKKRPFYSIVVADSRTPRDGRFIEKVGTYNPMVDVDHPERLTMKIERVREWMGKGAKPTERVSRMMAKAGLSAPYEWRESPKKSLPGEKAKMRAEEKAEKARAAEEAAAEAAESADA